MHALCHLAENVSEASSPFGTLNTENMLHVSRKSGVSHLQWPAVSFEFRREPEGRFPFCF